MEHGKCQAERYLLWAWHLQFIYNYITFMYMYLKTETNSTEILYQELISPRRVGYV